jgi:hypothetical protein
MPGKENYNTIFGRIVLSKFDGMPEWVRICAFLTALLVIVYLALHSVNAEYFVGGTVLEPSPGHPGYKRAGRGYDVRWADKYAGTNSKGHFGFVLSPMEYFGLLKAGNQSLEIWKSGNEDDVEDQEICKKSVKFQRFESNFEDYYVDNKCALAEAAQTTRPGTALVPTVYASEPSGAGASYHILVKTLQFAPQWARSDSAEIILFLGGEEWPLRNPDGKIYGAVSILPGESFAFRDGVYLPAKSLGGGRVRLSDRRGFLNYTEEWFDLPNILEIGKSSTVRGSLGSSLDVVPVGRSTITIFRKYGDAAYYSGLAENLLAIGVLPMSSASPLGAEKPINTLFVGPSVEPSTVKSVLAALTKNGVQLKRIAYPYTFESTADTSRIQLGWSAQCVHSALIPKANIADLAATPDSHFAEAVKKYIECKPHP